ENPPLLFDLTSLQREANRRWGMTASATLAAAQRLYEAKLITYPRTDSRFLTPDVARTTRTIIDGLAEQAGLAVWCRGADPAAIHGHGRVINPGRVADHHAIIPTGERPGALSPSDAKVYGLIAGRFLAQFYPPAVDRVRRVMTTVGIDDFETVGRVTMVEGWRVVELGEQARGDRRRGDKRRGEEDGGGLSSLDGLSVGDEVLCTEARLKDGRTEPPPRYTEGSLLAAMETAGRHVDDEALREAMKGRGLGTPATRAAIIDRLKRVGYVEVAARRLRPTAKGIQLIEAARAAGAEVLLSPQLTGEWEQRINAVQTAEVDPARFMGEIEGLTGALVEKVKGWSTGPRAAVGGDPGGAAGPPPTLKCPLCGRGVTLVRGRWVCAGNESDCRFRVGAWILGRRIESADLAELCQKGRTRLLTGFRSRNGRRFAARLVAGPAGVTFEFARHRGKSGPPAKLAPQNEGSAKVAQKARGNTRRKTSARATKPRRTAE
ncbi:MAG TPA: DNA topoisomerase, partial [Bacillota bacterium]